MKGPSAPAESCGHLWRISAGARGSFRTSGPHTRRDRLTALLLLDVHGHARGTERELDSLAPRPECDSHAVLILHRRDAGAAADCGARADGGVGAVEVLELLQVVDGSRRARPRDPDRPYRKPVDAHRIPLAAVRERSAPPAEADPRRDRPLAELEGRIRTLPLCQSRRERQAQCCRNHETECQLTHPSPPFEWPAAGTTTGPAQSVPATSHVSTRSLEQPPGCQVVQLRSDGRAIRFRGRRAPAWIILGAATRVVGSAVNVTSSAWAASYSSALATPAATTAALCLAIEISWRCLWGPSRKAGWTTLTRMSVRPADESIAGRRVRRRRRRPGAAPSPGTMRLDGRRLDRSDG